MSSISYCPQHFPTFRFYYTITITITITIHSAITIHIITIMIMCSNQRTTADCWDTSSLNTPVFVFVIVSFYICI